MKYILGNHENFENHENRFTYDTGKFHVINYPTGLQIRRLVDDGMSSELVCAVGRNSRHYVSLNKELYRSLTDIDHDTNGNVFTEKHDPDAVVTRHINKIRSEAMAAYISEGAVA